MSEMHQFIYIKWHRT